MTSVNDLKMKINGEWVSVLENAGRTNVIPTLTLTPLGSIGTCIMQSSDMELQVFSKTYSIPKLDTETYQILATFTFTPTNYEYSTIPDYYKVDPSFTGLTDISKALVSMQCYAYTTTHAKLVNSTTGVTIKEIGPNDSTKYTLEIGANNLNDVYILYGYRTYGSQNYTVTLTCEQCNLYASITGAN